MAAETELHADVTVTNRVGSGILDLLIVTLTYIVLLLVINLFSSLLFCALRHMQVTVQMGGKPGKKSTDRRLTGAGNIDEILNEVIFLKFGTYIYS